MKQNVEASQLWQTIEHLLSNDRERRVAYLLFHCGMKPAEIVQFVSHEFDDVEEVTHLRRVILQRIICSEELVY